MRSWKSMLPRLAIIFSLVGLIHYYLYVRIVEAADLSPGLGRAGAIVFVLMAVLTAFGMVATRVLPRPTSTAIGFLVFTWFGFVIILFFLSVGSELARLLAGILGAVGVFRHDAEQRALLSRILSATIAGGGAVLGIYAYAVARGRVGVERVRVALKGFPPSMNGFRIAQLSDVHIGPTIGKDWLTEVVARVNTTEPDLIVITGDLVDGSVADLSEHVAPLKDLKAKHGVYFVTGNHEYYSGADKWIAHLTSLGVRVLRNERVPIAQGDDSFDLAGVDDWRAKNMVPGHGPDLAKALADRDPERAVVLLAHQPKQAIDAAKAGVGLQLSGHTHGGQIFPWNFFVRIDQPFIAGLDRIGDFQIYTSRGTGYWGPPMRLGAPPEITLLELRASDHSPVIELQASGASVRPAEE